MTHVAATTDVSPAGTDGRTGSIIMGRGLIHIYSLDRRSYQRPIVQGPIQYGTNGWRLFHERESFSFFLEQ
jgi:hypothetical protein